MGELLMLVRRTSILYVPVWAVTALLVLLTATTMTAAAVSANSGDVEVDPGKVYFGDVSRFDPARQDKVGTVRVAEFYEATEPVKIIRKEKIARDSARYNKLMKQATAIFKQTLVRVAGSQRLVLIVEEGGIRGYASTDVTRMMIGML